MDIIDANEIRMSIDFNFIHENNYRLNRAWEKERRDRLNVTFDKLAKLLPEYQPKINFSKIEILQKSIIYIEDLRTKLKELLSTENSSILSMN